MNHRGSPHFETLITDDIPAILNAVPNQIATKRTTATTGSRIFGHAKERDKHRSVGVGTGIPGIIGKSIRYGVNKFDIMWFIGSTPYFINERCTNLLVYLQT
jgi:hypothetical protein